jgi:predicted nucleic acid-binding protein
MPSRSLFADAFYWIGVILPHDSQHARVMSFSRALGASRIVTTDDVLTEVLNHLSRSGPFWRTKAAALVHQLRSDPRTNVLPQTRADFDAALAFYESRLDKGYSLTDCHSMLAMKSLGVIEVLTNDHHFEQEVLTIIFPSPSN